MVRIYFLQPLSEFLFASILQKIKRKIGRKLPPPNNATNTQVKSKGKEWTHQPYTWQAPAQSLPLKLRAALWMDCNLNFLLEDPNRLINGHFLVESEPSTFFFHFIYLLVADWVVRIAWWVLFLNCMWARILNSHWSDDPNRLIDGHSPA